MPRQDCGRRDSENEQRSQLAPGSWPGTPGGVLAGDDCLVGAAWPRDCLPSKEMRPNVREAGFDLGLRRLAITKATQIPSNPRDGVPATLHDFKWASGVRLAPPSHDLGNLVG